MRLWENKCDLMGKRMDLKAYGKLNVILWEEFPYGKINVILWEKKCYALFKYATRTQQCLMSKIYFKFCAFRKFVIIFCGGQTVEKQVKYILYCKFLKISAIMTII